MMTPPTTDKCLTEYAVVLHADDAQLAAVAAFRKQIGLRRAMYEAHVTLEGPFASIEDLTGLVAAVADAAKDLEPVPIRFARRPLVHVPSGILVPVELTPEIVRVRRRVVDALAGSVSGASSDDGFDPHLTLCYGCTAKQLDSARDSADTVQLGVGFTAIALDLMTRTGDPLKGGYCSIVASFPVGVITGTKRDLLHELYSEQLRLPFK